MLLLQEYRDCYRDEWNTFISHAKNSHFMFHRDYMDYHSDRFVDASLMFYEKNKLVAVFVANVSGEVIYSHQGLTFGGLVMSKTIRAEMVLAIFERLVDHYKNIGKGKLIYKAIPYIYHRYPADEDLYAISRYPFKLFRRDISSAIQLGSSLGYTESRNSSLRKFRSSDICITESDQPYEFVKLLTTVVNKHGAKPVHSVDEISLLMKRFPNNIKLLTAHRQSELVAGALFFLNEPVVHAQYLASSEAGKLTGALDGIIDYMIEKYKQHNGYQYFNFGISTTNNGNLLNNGLIFQKEGFGGRGVVHDFYEIEF